MPGLVVGEEQPLSFSDLARVDVVRREGVRQQFGEVGHFGGRQDRGTGGQRVGDPPDVRQQHAVVRIGEP